MKEIKMPKQVDKIQFHMIYKLMQKNSGYVIPNYYWSVFECDILHVSAAGYTTEYEIKVTRSDFQADFEKETLFSSHFSVPRGSIKKHDRIKEGRRTNRFIFVVPANLIDKTEVPDYAGLVELENLDCPYPLFKTVKNAKRLHNRRADQSIYDDLLSKYYNRYLYQTYFKRYFKFLDEIQKKRENYGRRKNNSRRNKLRFQRGNGVSLLA